MKKITAVILVLYMCIALCSCGTVIGASEPKKSDEAQKADELILAIGDVTLDSEAAIVLAKGYYDTLAEEEKAEVENYYILDAAILEYESLVNESVYNEAIAMEINDPDGAIALYLTLPEGYKDVTERIYALENPKISISAAENCSILYDINGVLAIGETCEIELRKGENVVFSIIPICDACGEEQSLISFSIPMHEFSEIGIVQKNGYAPCTNPSCSTLYFLYMVNVFKGEPLW